MSDTKDFYSDEAREAAILLAAERLRKYIHEFYTGQYLASGERPAVTGRIHSEDA